MPDIVYSGGSILIKGYDGNIPEDLAVFDHRIACYRSLGVNYPRILSFFRDAGIDAVDRVMDRKHLNLNGRISLRPYQLQALEEWKKYGMRGTVVLPTAAGKTHIGMAAIQAVSERALILVPTIDLLSQWKKRIQETFGVEPGQIGGGEHDERDITVSTYDSAYLMAEKYGNRFSLIIADEVHHLASEKLRMIPLMYTAPFRMGLTATYERTDGLQKVLEQIMGGKIFELGYEEIDEYLADYTIARIPIELSDEEYADYQRYHEIFVSYLRRHRMVMRGPWDFEKFIRSSWTPEGREALIAWRKSREIAFNSRGKMEMIRTILSKHRGEKTLIFAEDTETAYTISKEFLIPAITYLTDKEEREKIPAMFREGRITAIATSRVLDEGVDFPDASVAIVVSGSGSMRQFRQRLGRILRPSAGKKAVMYELVTAETSEFGVSRRRRKGVPGRTDGGT
ncbi:DNA repair protein RAD25 related protein [Thermoplasma acidophilum]|uniref:DNA 3'-5' helicase n=1 Tax=Thermoplasma acidophilum (strain ATCC 25905 / DSM 1728 / JCM 9062 / NBRC 15155 / AMRC-C165) TaxID=273075 RepID=Q9HJF3_THEAC|nr:DEAD/DEAH box helicase family protein [Thermoplasma acidophilum]MCY0851748.1 DEAD/DEAH box helicase family protein [Thermoplasma acidophilum]CAC12145.1 DNA repair protein RAD25 related protein [Thermoplasma acidophilum]